MQPLRSRSYCRFATVSLHGTPVVKTHAYIIKRPMVACSARGAEGRRTKSGARRPHIYVPHRSASSHFRNLIPLPKAMADLLPYGFIWTPFCPDLHQAIFEPRYTFQKLWQICFHMASFGHRSVQICIKPFSKPDTPSKSYG